MENNEKKTNDKKHILDWIIAALVLISLVVIYFFWGCKMDLWVTILCVVLVAAGSALLQMQHKRIKEAIGTDTK